MLGLVLYLVDFSGNARIHVAIVPFVWLLAYLVTLICEVFTQAIPHKPHIFMAHSLFAIGYEMLDLMGRVSPVEEGLASKSASAIFFQKKELGRSWGWALIE